MRIQYTNARGIYLMVDPELARVDTVREAARTVRRVLGTVRRVPIARLSREPENVVAVWRGPRGTAKLYWEDER